MAKASPDLMSSQAPFITAPINDQVLSVYHHHHHHHHHHHRTNQWWWWVQKRTTIGTKPVKKRCLNKNKMANSGLLINWSDQICSLWYSLLLIWSPADKINTGYGVTSEADNKIQGITVHCHKSYVTLWLEGSPTTHTPRTRPITISLTVRYSFFLRRWWHQERQGIADHRSQQKHTSLMVFTGGDGKPMSQTKSCLFWRQIQESSWDKYSWSVERNAVNKSTGQLSLSAYSSQLTVRPSVHLTSEHWVVGGETADLSHKIQSHCTTYI